MTLNETYNQIELETAQCVERKYDFFAFKPRRAYEPECRAQAKAKYQAQIENEVYENEIITDAVQSKLLAADSSILITLIIGFLAIILTYYFIFK